jgi:hypothetical protein
MARTGAGLGLAPGIADYEEVDKAYEKSARERAAEGIERAARAGLNPQPRTRTRHTTIAEAILAEADEVGARTIILGTRGLTGIKSLLLGSVSHADAQLHALAASTLPITPAASGWRAASRRRSATRRSAPSRPPA